MLSKNKIYIPHTEAFSFCVMHTESAKDILPDPTQGRLYINNGIDAILQVGRYVYPFRNGDVIYASACEECRVLPSDAEKMLSVYILSFEEQTLLLLAPFLSERSAVGKARYLFPFEISKTLFALCRELLVSDGTLAIYRVFQLLSLLEQEAQLEMEEIYDIPLPILLRRAMSYAEQFPKEATSALLSARYGISESTLFRLFRTNLQITPRKYLLRARTRKSARLLLEGESVSRTADACGFESGAQLLHSFRQVFDKDPK